MSFYVRAMAMTVSDAVFEYWRSLLEASPPEEIGRRLQLLESFVLPQIGEVQVEAGIAEALAHLAGDLNAALGRDEAVEVLGVLADVFRCVSFRCGCPRCGSFAFCGEASGVSCASCGWSARSSE